MVRGMPIFGMPRIIIIDEAHMTSQENELLFVSCKIMLDYMKKKAPFIIILSASIDIESFIKYYEIEKQQCIEINEGMYKIDHIFLREDLEITNFKYCLTGYIMEIIELKEPKSNVLVFIQAAKLQNIIYTYLTQFFEKRGTKDIKIFEYSRDLLISNQNLMNEILESDANPEIKTIIIATNAIETGITIPNIRYVVESGFQKNIIYDPFSNRYIIYNNQPISLNSVEQRCGRTGRITNGTCYHLYTEKIYKEMKEKTISCLFYEDISAYYIKLAKFIYEMNLIKKKYNILEPEKYSFTRIPDAMAARCKKIMIFAELIPESIFAQIYISIPKLSPNNFRMIMSGFAYNVALCDLISLAAWIEQKNKIDEKITKENDDIYNIYHYIRKIFENDDIYKKQKNYIYDRCDMVRRFTQNKVECYHIESLYSDPI
jgi:hypothetical protein